MKGVVEADTGDVRRYMKSAKECFAKCTVHVITILMVMLIAIIHKGLIPLLFRRQLGHVNKAQGTSGEVS